MCAMRMHAVLAKRGNALLIPALTYMLPDGRWRVVAQPAIESDSGNERHLVQRTWEVFEAAIRERPEMWLWAYKHFKYRPLSARRTYPFYAGHTPDFDLMGQEPETTGKTADEK
jgi:lauroyl/myristoyl acyltransferase